VVTVGTAIGGCVVGTNLGDAGTWARSRGCVENDAGTTGEDDGDGDSGELASASRGLAPRSTIESIDDERDERRRDEGAAGELWRPPPTSVWLPPSASLPYSESASELVDADSAFRWLELELLEASDEAEDKDEGMEDEEDARRLRMDLHVPVSSAALWVA
jgi:hypothetical protein